MLILPWKDLGIYALGFFTFFKFSACSNTRLGFLSFMVRTTVFPALIPHEELLFQTPQKGGELIRGGEFNRGRNYCLELTFLSLFES
jgi:hypothetical protein